MKAYENLYGSRGSNPMVLLEKNICFTRLIIIQKTYELESWKRSIIQQITCI